MARPPQLNWEPARSKWKLVYKGQKYRFDGGAGKSDRDAKKRADAEWKALKSKLDSEADRAKPHRVEYEKVIGEWTNVLTWSMDHGDEMTADIARSKIQELQDRLAQRTPPSLVWADRFFAGPAPRDGTNEPAELPLGAVDTPWEAGATGTAMQGPIHTDTGEEPLIPGRVTQEQTLTGPAPFTHELWHDRLNAQDRRRQQTGCDDTFATNVERFLDGKRNEVAAEQLSAARADALRTYLDIVMRFTGRTTSVSLITGETLAAFRQHLLQRIAAKEISDYYARDVLAAFKLFVRWLVNNTDKLEHLPKNIDDKRLSISVGQRKAKTLSRDQVQMLLKAANDRTRLYMLLGLNCAMTQQDIADLQQSEVRWSEGQIIRKRSKTSDCANVPEVTYRLWPVTFELLKKARSSQERVLLTREGESLKTEFITADKKLRKTDAVRLALRRLSKKTSIPFTMKMLKKTAATALRNHRDYQGLESLFLDHAPTTVAHRHYAGVPQELLDEAIEWLGTQYGIIEAPSESKEAGESRSASTRKKKSPS